MSATTFLDNAIANHVFRNSAYAPAATLYLAAFTAVADAKAGAVTEVAGGAYARQAIAFGAPAAGVISNSAQINFPIATAGWGTVTAVGIYDSAAAGNLLQVANLTTPQAIGVGNQLVFDTAANKVTLTVD